MVSDIRVFLKEGEVTFYSRSWIGKTHKEVYKDISCMVKKYRGKRLRKARAILKAEGIMHPHNFFREMGEARPKVFRLYRSKGEERKKDTANVSSVSTNPQEDAEMHGGDGNSGEVDAVAETSSEDSTCEDSKEFKEGVNGNGGETIPIIGKGWKKSSSPAPFFPNKILGKDTKKLKKLLEKFFSTSLKRGDTIGGNMDSPRYEGHRLVREMVTKRWVLQRVHKKEFSAKPKRLLIAADVSGSCSSSSGATTGLCESLTHIWPELVYVVHANGDIYSITSKGQTTTLANVQASESYKFTTLAWEKISENVVGALFFGDFDGFDDWSACWRKNDNCRAVLLHSYRCSLVGPTEFGIQGFLQGYKCSEDKRLTHIIGVNSEQTAITAMEIAIANL